METGYRFSTLNGSLQGEGAGAWEAMVDALGRDAAHTLADDMLDLYWEPGFYGEDRCDKAEAVSDETGDPICMFYRF